MLKKVLHRLILYYSFPFHLILKLFLIKKKIGKNRWSASYFSPWLTQQGWIFSLWIFPFLVLSLWIPSSPGRSSKSQPSAQHPESTLFILLLPFPGTDTFAGFPQTSALRDNEHPSASESIKCSTGGRLSWLKIWSVLLCVSVSSRDVPWGGEKNY